METRAAERPQVSKRSSRILSLESSSLPRSTKQRQKTGHSKFAQSLLVFPTTRRLLKQKAAERTLSKSDLCSRGVWPNNLSKWTCVAKKVSLSIHLLLPINEPQVPSQLGSLISCRNLSDSRNPINSQAWSKSTTWLDRRSKYLALGPALLARLPSYSRKSLPSGSALNQRL